MNTQDKSLKLAELMKLEILDKPNFVGTVVSVPQNKQTEPYLRDRTHFEPLTMQWFHPYIECEEGLAQFAAILLKFPEVMSVLHAVDLKPTQTNILDGILRMNGVEI